MNQLNKPSLAERIKSVRILLDRSQSGMAATLGVSQANVSDVERGARLPSYEYIVGLMKLNVDIRWLLLGEGEAPTNDSDELIQTSEEELKVLLLKKRIESLSLEDLNAVNTVIDALEAHKKLIGKEALK